MTRRQLIALRYPLWTCTPGVTGQFHASHFLGLRSHLCIVKCASRFGGGRPVWHCSVAWRNPISPLVCVGTRRWPKVLRVQAAMLADELLVGLAGDLDSPVHGKVCLHLRRRLTVDELRIVGNGWQRIAAVDVATV